MRPVKKTEHQIAGVLKINDKSTEFIRMRFSQGNSIKMDIGFSIDKVEIDPNSEFIDMVFKFKYHARENTSEVNIRFIKSYPLTYNLDGGTLSKDSVTSYHSQEEITLPTPTKEGYDFAGWTGEGITTPNKNVTIPTGTTGPRSYIANWTKNSRHRQQQLKMIQSQLRNNLPLAQK